MLSNNIVKEFCFDGFSECFYVYLSGGFFDISIGIIGVMNEKRL